MENHSQQNNTTVIEHNKRVSFGGEEHVQMIEYDDGVENDYSIVGYRQQNKPTTYTEFTSIIIFMEKKNSPKTSGPSTTPFVQSPSRPPSETKSIKLFSAQHHSLYSGQPLNERDSNSSISVQLSDQHLSPSTQPSHEIVGQTQNLSHLPQKLFNDQFLIKHNNNHPQQPRRSISTAGVPQHFLPPHQSSTMTASAPSSLESDTSVAANSELFPSSHIIIRDPFAPDPPNTSAQLSLSPSNEHQHHLQPVMQPLQWDGKPPKDSKCMAELVAASDPSLPPMVPLPNIKEGGVPHGGVFPQWSFFNIPFQRQRLEQLYPEGTFPPTQWSRWSPMPMPMLRPVMPPRIILMPLKPGMQVSPGMVPPGLAGRIPSGHIPVLIVPGPTGQLVTLPLNAAHPSMFGMIPANMAHGASLASGFMGQQVQNNSGKQQGANTPSITSATMLASGTTTKAKKETARQRKQREKEEQQRREMDTQQNQQTNFTSAVRSPTLEEGSIPPGSSPFFGRQQIHQQMAAGVDGPLQGLQQDYCFKVPGRSPPIKRCTSSIPPTSASGIVPPATVGAALTPMPDQRIHAQGQCCVCQTEINHHRKAIKCTAISQGCNHLFHWECAGLSLDAFSEFCRDNRLEWICQMCFSTKKECLMFAC